MATFSQLFILVLSVLSTFSVTVSSHVLKVESERGSAVGDLYTSGSVYCQERTCRFEHGPPDWDHAAAAGAFNDTLLVTGWGVLDIGAGLAADTGLSDADLMFAAGFLEGVLTADHMENQFTNIDQTVFPKANDPVKRKLKTWLAKQRQWADSMVAQNLEDPFWRQTGYVLAQLDGLLAGYTSARGEKAILDMYSLNFLNAGGDFLDLINVVDKSHRRDWTKFTPKQAKKFFYENTRCSALIKILPGYENMYMSHSTWYLYQTTDRIYKHYNFDLKDVGTVAKKMSFSSYPGVLASLDDFYLLDSGLTMLQTTNNIFNMTLYDLVKPQSLLAWQRVRVANAMAKGGESWAENFGWYNSGTYNNQYMVIDLSLIKKRKPLADNTLWVVEQIPGYVVGQDLTRVLETGYFPSYNVPFFESIFKASGYSDYVKHHGLDYSYQLAQRAKIFRRDADDVKDMDSMKTFMRYNDFKNDPYSEGDPMATICSRGDLDEEPSTEGCIDTKVADLHMARALQADIVSGPTLGSGFKPFSWTGDFNSTISHEGLPDMYDFPFVRVKPSFW